MTLRKTTSLTTLLSFILLLATSIILYVTPQGKIAFWANWKIFGLGKEEWGALHTNLGFLFIIAGIIHTLLNWKPIVAYLKNRAKQLRVFTADFNLALAITLFITLFTLFDLPPVNAVQTFGESIKAAAAETYGEPPYGHAEASPLQAFCKRTGLDLDAALEALGKANLNAVSAQATLAEIAEANGMAPQQVYELMRAEERVNGQGEPAATPKGSGSGFGRKTLSSACAELGLDQETVAAGLRRLGIEADMDSTIKTIAEENRMEPQKLYEMVRQLPQEN